MPNKEALLHRIRKTLNTASRLKFQSKLQEHIFRDVAIRVETNLGSSTIEQSTH
jgi:hypothetical protein